MLYLDSDANFSWDEVLPLSAENWTWFRRAPNCIPVWPSINVFQTRGYWIWWRYRESLHYLRSLEATEDLMESVTLTPNGESVYYECYWPHHRSSHSTKHSVNCSHILRLGMPKKFGSWLHLSIQKTWGVSITNLYKRYIKYIWTGMKFVLIGNRV